MAVERILRLPASLGLSSLQFGGPFVYEVFGEVAVRLSKGGIAVKPPNGSAPYGRASVF
jgi:hypothetical protein